MEIRYRLEEFIDAIINKAAPPEPIYRIEYWLAKIAGAEVETLEPVYRVELFLAKIAGTDVEIPEPKYRVEYYLAALAGEDVEIPEPIYYIEHLLMRWIDSKGKNDSLV